MGLYRKLRGNPGLGHIQRSHRPYVDLRISHEGLCIFQCGNRGGCRGTEFLLTGNDSVSLSTSSKTPPPSPSPGNLRSPLGSGQRYVRCTLTRGGPCGRRTGSDQLLSASKRAGVLSPCCCSHPGKEVFCPHPGYSYGPVLVEAV